MVSLDGSAPRFVAAVKDTNFFITYAGEPFAWSPDSKSIAFISASEEPSLDPHNAARQTEIIKIGRLRVILQTRI